MSIKPGPISAAVIIAGALGFGFMSFKSSLISYLSFQEAMAASSSGSTVQIMGAPVKGETSFDSGSNALDFTLREPSTNQLMPVVFKSPKPDNFDEAIRVTAIGHYDPASKEFDADNLLVKCPSKYAGDPSAAQNRQYAAKA